MCKFIPNINREGYIFIAASFVVSCIAFALSWGIGITFLFLTLICIYFFRDPVRVVLNDENLILSPADGVIDKIMEIDYPLLDQKQDGEQEKLVCVSIFLSVMDVHVNRIPISGMVKNLVYKKGRFFSAMLDKSCYENEKQVILITCKDGKEVIVDQIAGLIARRIVCNLKVGQQVKAGERFGMIRFGSRVNIYFQHNIKLSVVEGQTVVGGETVIANLKDNSQKKLSFNII
ncbi:phosphatidylserine decarboxylase [Candidatus Mesenet endosymbiont of Agriotes lineatus]|uniref:phosphatidylserine decarboxylase n=1 Tax=Candidatus Mesenet endosymbiont of Agriotes lineatus TaxID=3077948 RepID=UPI0030D5B1D4